MKKIYKNLPDSPGVYLMKDARGEVLYVGKAGNLRRRVSSYFERPHDVRIEALVGKIKKIDYKKTDTALEALILEAKLIKKLRPPFNIREKDDKSFLYVEVTKEKFPRVLLARGRTVNGQASKVSCRYGPFTSASSIREALKILRRIFPWSMHANVSDAKNANIHELREKNSRHSHAFVDSHRDSRRRPCFDYEIGLCPGTCIQAVSRTDYLKNIRNIKLFFEGKKKKILSVLQKEMAAASKRLEFEKAEKLRRQIFALRHIRDVALIGDSDGQLSIVNGQMSYRIEGYDISNISGASAVGAMVVFMNGEPDKNEYRKFKIKTVVGSNDVGMIKEILRRRFRNNWPPPDLILIDGGRGQINAAKSILVEFGLKIPVIGIAKGQKRKRNDFIGFVPKGIDKKTLIRVRDEAHRFAIAYHKKLRSREFFKPGQQTYKFTAPSRSA